MRIVLVSILCNAGMIALMILYTCCTYFCIFCYNSGYYRLVLGLYLFLHSYKATIIIHRSGYFEDFLQHYSKFRVPDRTVLLQYIPKLLEREVESVREAVGDDCIGIMLDGMTRLGELFVIIIRFVTDDLALVQKLISIRTMAKSLNAKQMAAEMVNELTAQLNITGPDLGRLVCATHDRASVNQAAIREMVWYFHSISSLCASVWAWMHCRVCVCMCVCVCAWARALNNSNVNARTSSRHSHTCAICARSLLRFSYRKRPNLRQRGVLICPALRTSSTRLERSFSLPQCCHSSIKCAPSFPSALRQAASGNHRRIVHSPATLTHAGA
jgi:hypothetical protein